MKFLNLTYKNKEIVFFSVLFSILLIKFFCISPLNQNVFLTNYKFFTPDSYDWVANGVRMFQSKNVSFRNPGLPFIIFILFNLKILYLLPLFNYIVFFCLLIFVYKTTKFLTKEGFFPILGVLFIFLNYSFQDFSNIIYADYYAIAFLSASLYFLITKKNKLSFFTLGLSAIFQNLAFFVLPLWFIYLFILKFDKKDSISSQIKNLKYYIFCFLFFFIFPGSWFLYKFILFGNPLYSKIAQFELLHLNFNLLFYYLINSLTLFGPILFLIKKIDFKKKNFNIFFLVLVSVYIFSFWTFLYYWADRRFLLYQIPSLYPLLFYFAKNKFYLKSKVFTFIILILFLYPTTISIGKGYTSNIVPLTNWHELKFQVYGDESQQTLIKFPLDFVKIDYPKKYILFPALAEIVVNREYLVNSSNTLYNTFKNIIDVYYSDNKCINIKDVSVYEFNAVLQIEKNKSINEMESIFCKK